MSDKPMMKCGHAANAVKTGTDIPVCVVCYGIVPGADVVDDLPPDLSGRFAECAYNPTSSRVPSSTNLAFFSYQPDRKVDSYFCGCRGWD